ncbi:threonylcarbamoyl-AMP synthase [Agromyces protaetiae]|uniref:L-threonylcarbamoyladenylate synthase n=1 Tax=Agromyces protaetiae TaxID=2509455 RepID=A0A4P6FEA4_9MICO|nr:L-threonylcarbamoyladenylate synthase [Agromyces protaetiae]QAY74472.1 threonylcarbamoyl-AMP synthase [Agromyces protaetiae]
MTAIYDCSVDSELLTGMRLARGAIGRGELVVLPTDTVYGVAADAFSPAAVQRLLDAKGRGRTAPPPVLIPGLPTLDALATDIPAAARALAEAFWPGGLTIILRAQPSLQWDLGETRGTVALRMPDHRIALELLSETGPLAVSSANLSGQPAATDARAAADMLGDSVAVYLDGGESGSSSDLPSTIVDATGERLRIVREGVLSREALAAVAGADAFEADAPGSASEASVAVEASEESEASATEPGEAAAS